MTNIIEFNSPEDAQKYFFKKSNETFQITLGESNLDWKSLERMGLDELKAAKLRAEELFLNQDFLKANEIYYKIGEHFNIKGNEQITGIKFAIFYQYKNLHNFITKRIKEIEQSQSVESIEKLVKEIKDTELKGRFETQLNELKDANKRLEAELTTLYEKRGLVSEEIEFSRHKTEMMEKKYNIFLKFLDKESVASIVGAILLLLMGISLIIMMFYEINPIQIVQSAFLLILGYFFGHSKNNK